MSTFDRAAHCRKIARKGGLAVVAKHGTSYMRQIGARGFRVAVDLGWGEMLAAKLGDAYQAKFGRPLELGPAAKEKAQARARARRLYSGMLCQTPGCTEVGQVHHIEQFAVQGDPNAGTNIEIHCTAHHVAIHRERRRAHMARRSVNE